MKKRYGVREVRDAERSWLLGYNVYDRQRGEFLPRCGTTDKLSMLALARKLNQGRV
jgi:hypothetical protein